MILGKYNTVDFINPESERDLTYYADVVLRPDSVDVSSVENWGIYGLISGADYLCVKLEIKALLDATAGATEQDRFDNLASDEERDIVCKYNVITDSIAVGFYMAYLSLSVEDATGYHMTQIFQSMELNADACGVRFHNKHKWYPIMFTFYSQVVGESIIEAVREYVHAYVTYARFGTAYGDNELGLFDFIDGTGGIIVDLEDYELQEGATLADARTALKTYFYG